MSIEKTPNYNLNKPTYEEFGDVADLNANADIIDAALQDKVDKEAGKGLSEANFTASEKSKLAGIATGANKTVIANALTETVAGKALDAVQGKALAEQIGTISGKRTARFVIGTSTAGWTSADCDYLCDGTADQTEINNAITALPANGGEIVILDGTYNIIKKIDVTKDNVSIRGNGNATILKRMFDSYVKEGVITLTSRSGCKIANLQVDGNKISYTNSNNYSIYLDASSDNTVTGNTCNKNISGIRLSSSSNNAVTGNTCNKNISGIDLNSSSDNKVTGNTCNNNNSTGIRLSSSSDNTVTGNTCNKNISGIYLNSSSNNAVTGNTCNNNNGYGTGIYLDASSDNTVTGNTCNNNDNYSIYLDASSDNTVTGNTCNKNISGIYLSNSNNNIVTGNTCIRGTGLATDYAASQHTIQLQGTGNRYNLISNNNCMGKAVTSEGGTGNTLVNNKFDAT